MRQNNCRRFDSSFFHILKVAFYFISCRWLTLTFSNILLYNFVWISFDQFRRIQTQLMSELIHIDLKIYFFSFLRLTFE